MNEQVKKIYDFVSQSDKMNTAQAASFQKVRYFIEEMVYCSSEKGGAE